MGRMTKIEKNVPIPKSTESTYPFKEMEIGDSFFVPLIEWVDFSMSGGGLYRLSDFYASERQFISRRIEGPIAGFRVWRIPMPQSDESRIFWEQNKKINQL